MTPKTKLRINVNGIDVQIESDEAVQLVIELQKLDAILRDLVDAARVTIASARPAPARRA